ncbi:MAG: hypothetical protein GX610_17000, partial [Rhodococcus sp.]|nr:hypothetical protein [Rhodococcus sp. (in: high G+C Gram-positive bacteria)]
QGREDGALGYPISDEQVTADGVGHFARFESGDYIYSIAPVGAWTVPWQVHGIWEAFDLENGPFGYPSGLPKYQPEPGIVWRQEFQRGSLAISPSGEAYFYHY